MNNLYTYWVTFSLIRDLTTRRKNEIYIQCFHRNRSIADLFEDSSLQDNLDITPEERQCIRVAATELNANSFLVETLLDQGYGIIPIDSPLYPKAMKESLKVSAPTILYTKGNPALLNQPTIAIVGSRKADAHSLEFTDNVAREASVHDMVVVSGFAQGVDRQALDSTLKYGGRSIIVLPQGILTFSAGFKEYYRQIASGSVVVISEFPPNAGWSVGLAMARNQTIYAMARTIFVAQSDTKGGTWEGVTVGLKQKRSIMVRVPVEGETSANAQLIMLGAQAVDFQGKPVEFTLAPEEAMRLNPALAVEQQLPKLLKRQAMNSKEILDALGLEWSEAKLRNHLSTLDYVEKFKQKSRTYYRLRHTTPPSLFDSDSL